MASTQVFWRDDMYKFNLEAFLPYICECVKATDLLVHLPVKYFSKEHRKEIFKMCGQNNIEAMKRAVEVLLYENKEPGRFIAIRDAIQKSKYPKIVQMLDGEAVPNDDNFRKLLDLFADEIVKHLDPEELLPTLTRKSVIIASDAETIRAEERNHGKRRACWVLLYHLPNRVESWFQDFIEALIDRNYADIAKLLDPDLFNSMAEKRKKSMCNGGLGLDGSTHVVVEHTTAKTVHDDLCNMLKKKDFEVLEKNVFKPSDHSHGKELADNCKLVSLLDGIRELKDSDETVCKQLAVEDVASGNLRHKEAEDIACSTQTNKGHGKKNTEKTGSDKCLKYDREFLIRCRYSQLSMVFPKDIEKVPEVMLPVTRPKTYDKCLKYDREFLIGCRYSQLSMVFPKDIEKVPEVMLPVTRPKTYDKCLKYGREFLIGCRYSELSTVFPKDIENVPEVMLPVTRPKTYDKCLKYDREFLIGCRYSQLSMVFPKDIEKVPQVMLPVTRPKTYDKCLKYDREFLIGCRYSQLSMVFPKDIEKVPEVMLPVARPKTYRTKCLKYDREFLIGCRYSQLSMVFPKDIEKVPEVMLPVTRPKTYGKGSICLHEGIQNLILIINIIIIIFVILTSLDREFLIGCRYSQLPMVFPKYIENVPEVMLPVTRPKTYDKCLKYDWEFLIGCRYSQLSMVFPKDIEKVPEVMLPVTRPKTYDREFLIGSRYSQLPMVFPKYIENVPEVMLPVTRPKTYGPPEMLAPHREVSITRNIPETREDLLSSVIYENNFEDLEDEVDVVSSEKIYQNQEIGHLKDLVPNDETLMSEKPEKETNMTKAKQLKQGVGTFRVEGLNSSKTELLDSNFDKLKAELPSRDEQAPKKNNHQETLNLEIETRVNEPNIARADRATSKLLTEQSLEKDKVNENDEVICTNVLTVSPEANKADAETMRKESIDTKVETEKAKEFPAVESSRAEKFKVCDKYIKDVVHLGARRMEELGPNTEKVRSDIPNADAINLSLELYNPYSEIVEKNADIKQDIEIVRSDLTKLGESISPPEEFYLTAEEVSLDKRDGLNADLRADLKDPNSAVEIMRSENRGTAPDDTTIQGNIDFDFLLNEGASLDLKEDDDIGKVTNVRQVEEEKENSDEKFRDLPHVNAEPVDQFLNVPKDIFGQDFAPELTEEDVIAMEFLGVNYFDLYEAQDNLADTDFDIRTDVNDIDADDEDIPLRDYQRELAKEGSEGKNVIVMAPTNTGKTRVACRIMQVHLRAHRREGMIAKVIFLVENEALALQQGKVCAELLPAYRTMVVTGSIQRDKKQYLTDFVGRRDILVVTAQVLLNALRLQEIDCVTTFSMIVFDECHHANNYHRFNEIMGRYIDLKLRQNLNADQLPQIVGLTASLGVGGSTNHDVAKNHMKDLLANLDAKFLCTVRRNIEDLRRYENNPIERTVAAKRRQNDQYRNAILNVMDIIADYMIGHPSVQDLPKHDEFIKEVCQVPPCRGTEKFLQWLSDFKKSLGRLRSDTVRRMMNPCRIHLEIYNKALMIHADARIKDAAQILDEYMEDFRVITPKDDTDVMLLDLYDNIKVVDFSRELENPKLLEMERIVMATLGNNEDARGIVFVKTRELAQALVTWMKETAPLNLLNATEFVGQVASKADGGMTKCGQKDVLEYFKGGRHKIIVATSVAEEGLDITKCNLVIRYEHVTNEIVRLQSRGRARQQNSRYYVLTEEGSWIVAKEEKNAQLERVMNIVVPQLQAYIEDHPLLWEQELWDIQEKQKEKEELKEKQRKANTTTDEQEFRCLNCSNFICFLSDIRKIQDAHHVAVNEEVQGRVITVRSPVPEFMDDELKFDGGIFCGNRDCQYVLGGVCEYKHTEFPLLKIKQFRVVNKAGQGNTFKKWKKANFQVQQFTLDDLREVVERRRAAM